MYYCCAITETGRRVHNEDAVLLPRTVITEGSGQIGTDAPFLTAVADGVSGEAAGEFASKLCMQALAATKPGKKLSLKKRLMEIHRQILSEGRAVEGHANMQTTVCGIAVDEQHVLHCFHVGDSRLYRIRCGACEQITRDQTLVQMLYDEGTITREEKKRHTHRHIVLPVLGNPDAQPKPEIRSFPEGIASGDVLLLCTDGLTDSVSDREIAELMTAPKPLPVRLEMLVQFALEKGSRDNISLAAICRYPEQVPLPPCDWV